MLPRLGLVAFALAALTYVLALDAQESSAPKSGDSGQLKENLSLKELQLSRQFQEFEQQLLRLKQRLERSPKQEDRDRAMVLDKVLEYCKEKSISVQFEQVIDMLKSKELRSLPEIKPALERSTQIAEDLKVVITMLREDTRAKILRDEIKSLKDIINSLDKVIQEQKGVEGLTQNNKTDKNELKNLQARVTEKTAEIGKKLGDKNGANGQDGKDAKGGPKSAGKNGDQAGKSKGEEQVASNAGQSKAGGDSKEDKGNAKGNEGSGKEGAGKEGTGKEGSGKEGSGKEGAAKGGKGAEGGKEGSNKDGKGSEGGAQAKEGGKGSEGSKGDPKQGNGKAGDPAQAKAGGSKAGDPSKAGGDPSKSGSQAKGGEGSEGKAGSKGSKSGGEGSQAKSGSQPGQKADSKSGDSSSGKSQAKGDGSPSQGSPSQGSPSQGSQASNKGGKKGDQPPSPSPNSPPKDDVATGKKQIEEAGYKQKEAEAKIDDGKNDDASGKQIAAIRDLEKAKKDLEKLLRQLREEELERLLAALQARCEKMLAMQLQVLAGTEQVDKAIAINDDKQANRANKQDSLKLSDQESEIVVEASKAIELLESEGSAVAFPEVFQQVREDMKHVQRRLGVTDVFQVTQGIERDIVDSLKEMIEALKKARQEMADSKSKPGPPSQPPPNADQKLLDKIAELKMVRSMQIRVNARTTTYGKMYQGEQAADRNIRRELHDLSGRQERIFEITNRMAKGDNR